MIPDLLRFPRGSGDGKPVGFKELEGTKEKSSLELIVVG
jgi:hypothetical protein